METPFSNLTSATLRWIERGPCATRRNYACSCVLAPDLTLGKNATLMAGSSQSSYSRGKGKRPRSTPGVAAIKVAIVEDDDWIRENLASQINLAPGYRCISRYRTGEEALAGLPSDAPDVVLMDINLPGLSGIECVRRLKACGHRSISSCSRFTRRVTRFSIR